MEGKLSGTYGEKWSWQGEHSDYMYLMCDCADPDHPLFAQFSMNPDPDWHAASIGMGIDAAWMRWPQRLWAAWKILCGSRLYGPGKC
jgi:hypothetical protein